jgi:CHAD domain-containing protein
MGRRINLKINRSLRENAGLLLPAMFDRLMSYRRQVAAHPDAAEQLHEMRIAGRPMRYTMEAFAPAFGGKFARCLAEVKHLLDVAGLVHDSDVMIGMLENSLPVVQRYALMRGDGGVSPAINRIRKLLITQKRKRAVRFSELSTLMMSWNKRKFKKRLLSSMQ